MQITVAETVGVERRGNFYEQTGALRDMVPNHVFQLVAMTAMEPPVSFDADCDPDQEGRGVRGDAAGAGRKTRCAANTGRARCCGKRCAAIARSRTSRPTRRSRPMSRCGCKSTIGAGPGVPFYLRTGKHLCQRTTEIAIRFKQAPLRAVRGHAGGRAAAELAGAADPARRGHLVAVRGETSGAGGRSRTGADGLPLQRLVPGRSRTSATRP